MSPFKKLWFAFLILTAATAGVPFANAASITQSNQKGQNLLTYSEQFDNAAWTKSQATIVTNVDVAPDGTMSADRLTETAVTNVHNVILVATPSVATGASVDYSIYAKAGTRSWLIIGTSVGRAAWFDLSNGVVGSVNAGLTANIVRAPNGYFRCSISFANDGSRPMFYITTGNGAANYAGDITKYISIWGAQVAPGASVAAYNRTVASALNPTFVPTGVTKSNQMGQNFVLRSEEFGSTWATGNGSITSNTTIAPNGTLTADTLTDTGANGIHYAIQTAAAVPNLANPALTFSVYLKAGTKTWAAIGGNSFAKNAYFDLVNGVVGSKSAGVTSKITPSTNGFYRCEISYTGTDKSVGIITATGDNGASYTGDGTGTIILWGAQLGIGSASIAYNRTIASALNSTFVPTGVTKSQQLGQNLIKHSQNITTATWSSDGTATVSTVTGVDPFGKISTFSRLTGPAGNVYVRNSAYYPVATAGTYTMSAWVRTVAGDTENMRLILSNPTIVSGNKSVNGTWGRISFTGVVPAGNVLSIFANGSALPAIDVYLYGLQIVKGSSPGALNITNGSQFNPNYVP